MFIKSLTITSNGKIIRDILFRKGINLIVDETPTDPDKKELSGNNVGKTTVLKLIDFCLGANREIIYQDNESKKNEYKLVKDFLINQEVLITLILKENLDDENSREIIIERNFLTKKELIRRIDSHDYTEDEFELKLSKLIYPNHRTYKPTFRQIISHNIRYQDDRLNNTLKTLSYGSDIMYETLYLFLFGCEFDKGEERQNAMAKLKQEEAFKNRLEKLQTKNAYETALSLINNEISNLNERKSKLNLNETFEADLEKLNQIKYQINQVSSALTNFNIRKGLIIDTENDLNSHISNIDIQQLQLIYQQASEYIGNIQKTFEELVDYHNKMITEKVKFITKDLPTINESILFKEAELKSLLEEEEKLSLAISKSDSFEDLEEIIGELNDKYQKKGEFENIISQISDVEKEMSETQEKLDGIDNEIFSTTFENHLKTQLFKFNNYFAAVSKEIYGEQYAIKYEIVKTQKGQQLYKFSAFNTNFSTGKKQGEITCFDIAYVLFADSENMPCLHFILNDRKELMHGNQLTKIAGLVKKHNVQFVVAILKDKLPPILNNEAYFVVKLSQDDKLLRIENNDKTKAITF